jgi:hypothetical protein
MQESLIVCFVKCRCRLKRRRNNWNSHFEQIGKRLDRIENTKPSEVVVGSGLDTKLSGILRDVSDTKNDVVRLTERVDNHIRFAWTTIAVLFALAGYFGKVLYDQQGTLSQIEGALPSVQLEKATSGKLNVEDAKRAQGLVAEARRVGRSIDPGILNRVGVRFISAAASPDAQLATATWDAVQEFVDYRSFLNSTLVPDTSSFIPLWSDCQVISGTTYGCRWSTKWRFDLQPVGYEYLPMSLYYKVGKEVPAGKAAVLERLDHHLNADQKTGPEFLLIDVGGTVSQTLDGFRFKNVIFRGVKILYRGGPTEMENVYFVNCTFQAINKPSARELLMTALAPAPTTFKAAS